MQSWKDTKFIWARLTLKENAGHCVSIEDHVSGIVKEDGAYCKNVCGTYVHGVFDKEDVAEAVVRALGEKKESMCRR